MRKATAAVLIAGVLTVGVGAVTPSPASAVGGTFVVPSGTAGYTAIPYLGWSISFSGGKVLNCGSVTWSGTVSNGANSFTATPTMSECFVKVGENTLPATVTTGGCDYTFNDLTYGGISNAWTAKTDLVCPAGQDIQVRIYANAASHTAGTRLCEYTIQAQTGLTGTTFYDNLNGTIDVDTASMSLAYTRVLGTIANCGAASASATYSGYMWVVPTGGKSIAMDE